MDWIGPKVWIAWPQVFLKELAKKTILNQSVHSSFLNLALLRKSQRCMYVYMSDLSLEEGHVGKPGRTDGHNLLCGSPSKEFPAGGGRERVLSHFVLDAVPGQEWLYCENHIALNSNGQILHCLPYPVVVAFFFSSWTLQKCDCLTNWAARQRQKCLEVLGCLFERENGVGKGMGWWTKLPLIKLLSTKNLTRADFSVVWIVTIPCWCLCNSEGITAAVLEEVALTEVCCVQCGAMKQG